MFHSQMHKTVNDLLAGPNGKNKLIYERAEGVVFPVLNPTTQAQRNDFKEAKQSFIVECMKTMLLFPNANCNLPVVWNNNPFLKIPEPSLEWNPGEIPQMGWKTLIRN